MNAHKFAAKFFFDPSTTVTPHEFVPVLHSWIQMHAAPDHLLVDVADYAHVVDGPGTVLVAHEGNFYTDRGQGRPGVLYTRKMPLAGSLKEKIAATFLIALQACERLEQDPRLHGRLIVKTNEAIFRINDRLEAPNTAETFAAVAPALTEVAREMFADPAVKLEHHSSPRTLFEASNQSSNSPSLKDLLTRLETLAPPALAKA